MQQVSVDCQTGETTCSPLDATQAQALLAQQALALAQEEERAADLLFRQQHLTALAGVRDALRQGGVTADAAALAGLVHKLVAAPPTPLSAPEMSTLARFVLRCLLP